MTSNADDSDPIDDEVADVVRRLRLRGLIIPFGERWVATEEGLAVLAELDTRTEDDQLPGGNGKRRST